MQVKKLAIFDLDGTLIDSVVDILDCINLMLEKFGFAKRNLEEVKQMIGNGAKNLVIKAIGQEISSEKLAQCLDYYNQIYTSSGSPKTKLFDGIGQLLKQLKERGYLLGIVTNKPQITTDEIKKTYLKDYDIDMIIGQQAGLKIKPDPQSVNLMIEKLAVDRENVYFIGDGETDVQVAINANVKGVSVLWGYRNRSQLEKVGSETFVSKPQDLLKILL